MKPRRGFTLVEMLIAILITGTGTVAVMRLMAPTLVATADTSHDVAIAMGLASLLIEEIDLVPFEDPDANCSFGREADETATDRTDYDDVDDYDGYTDEPPDDRDGTSDTAYAGFRRTVRVTNVETNDPGAANADGTTDAKELVVVVTRNSREVARLAVIRFFGANRSDRPLLEERFTLIPEK